MSIKHANGGHEQITAANGTIEAARARLEARLEEIAGISMGLDVFPRPYWFRWRVNWPAQNDGPSSKPARYWLLWHETSVEQVLARPVSQGAIIAALYILFFCGLPAILVRIGILHWHLPPRLYAFQVYGAFWAAWATAATKLTMAATRDLIRREIIPHLSERAADAIATSLAALARTKTLSCALAIGAAGAVLGGTLMFKDVEVPRSVPEVAFWSLGWFLLFTTSASVVINGQFYGTFSRHMAREAENLFGPDPSRSSLILSLSALGQIMLMFWFGVAFSIALIVPVAMIDWNHIDKVLNFLQLGAFVWAYLITTGIFSIGLGTIVFLAHETGIRRAVKAAINVALRPIEAAVGPLTARGGALSEDESKLFEELSTRHAAIAGSGSYRSAIITTISLALPLVLPIVTAIASRWRPS